MLNTQTLLAVAFMAMSLGTCLPGPSWAQTEANNLLIAKGYTQLASGAAEAAVKTFSEVLRADPSDVQARRYLASALLRAGKPEEGLQQIQYVIQMNPGQTIDQVTLGEAYYSNGNYDRAIDCLSKILADNPYMDAARIDLINTYLAANQTGKANDACLQGIQAAKTLPARSRYYQLLDKIQQKEQEEKDKSEHQPSAQS